jgi:hypothetical protein
MMASEHLCSAAAPFMPIQMCDVSHHHAIHWGNMPVFIIPRMGLCETVYHYVRPCEIALECPHS